MQRLASTSSRQQLKERGRVKPKHGRITNTQSHETHTTSKPSLLCRTYVSLLKQLEQEHGTGTRAWQTCSPGPGSTTTNEEMNHRCWRSWAARLTYHSMLGQVRALSQPHFCSMLCVCGCRPKHWSCVSGIREIGARQDDVVWAFHRV